MELAVFAFPNQMVFALVAKMSLATTRDYKSIKLLSLYGNETGLNSQENG